MVKALNSNSFFLGIENEFSDKKNSNKTKKERIDS
jgi:hypothetical protein